MDKESRKKKRKRPPDAEHIYTPLDKTSLVFASHLTTLVGVGLSLGIALAVLAIAHRFYAKYNAADGTSTPRNLLLSCTCHPLL